MQGNGIHHITAIAGSPQRNITFYARTLGLRLVKKTVNFDDPGTYHFYFGDAAGAPGTLITFFPWSGTAAGRLGIGEVAEVLIRVPEESFGYWTHRFIENGVLHENPETAFGEKRLPFRDPDGMRLALVGLKRPGAEHAWTGGPVDGAHAIRGLHGASLLVDAAEPTASILTGVLGFAETGRDGTRRRLDAASGHPGAIIEVREAGGFLPARMGSGSIHHIAFRAADDAVQAQLAETLRGEHRMRTTEQKDRQYFRSVYFREPGGVLFEIATDGPGFAIDEAADRLGQELKLPPFLEGHRRDIEARLPEVA
jgi:glyoxalase family protein